MFLLKYYQLKEYRERLCNVSFIIKHPIKNCTLKVRQEKSNFWGAVQVEPAFWIPQILEKATLFQKFLGVRIKYLIFSHEISKTFDLLFNNVILFSWTFRENISCRPSLTFYLNILFIL